MSDYVIIDAHVHTYQTREVGLQAKQGNTTTDYAGTVDELLPIMEKANISQAVMVNMLPLAEMKKAAVERLPEDLSQAQRDDALKEIDARMLGRLERRNSWTCDLTREHPNLIPFINLDPLQDDTTMTTELLDKVNNQGAKGIKLHPGSQWFYPSDRRLWPAYRTAQEMGLPIIFHAGRFMSPETYSRPNNFVEVLESFPELTLVMAHIGTGYENEAVSLSKDFHNLVFDCSAIIGSINPDGELTEERLASLIREVGVERVMFGSDFPWFDPADSVARLLHLEFSEEEKQLLFAENAIRIYKL
ncbi:MAG: amidohydrolase [Dehalococcoidales bacterium]|nr:MAG: amidohydrolase [Dehalococcoidales bacterium]